MSVLLPIAGTTALIAIAVLAMLSLDFIQSLGAAPAPGLMSQKSIVIVTPSPLDRFSADLIEIAPAAGMGAYAFLDGAHGCRGWVQLIPVSDRAAEIHRLWTLRPGVGHGSFMLGEVCRLADLHGIELRLKALPFGRKPYPMPAELLAAWYSRHGFEARGRKLVRIPSPVRS